MASSQGIEVINPLRHIGEAQYTELWQKLFSTVLAGFWGRFFFLVCVILTIFFGVRRRNPRAAVFFAFLAAVLAYGGGVLSLLRLVKLY